MVHTEIFNHFLYLKPFNCVANNKWQYLKPFKLCANWDMANFKILSINYSLYKSYQPTNFPLCIVVRPPTNQMSVLGYDIKPSDDEAPVMQELWGRQSAFSMPSLPDPLWSGEVGPDRVLYMGQIKLFDI